MPTRSYHGLLMAALQPPVAWTVLVGGAVESAIVDGRRFPLSAADVGGGGIDSADGLLRAGAPGVQLTWMDAKVGDWVVTPRIG